MIQDAAGAGRRWALGAGGGTGAVTVGADGSVTGVGHPHRDASLLLEELPDAPEAVFHEPGFRWGKGFVVTDRGGWRWDQPAAVGWRPDGVDVDYPLGPLRLGVRRRFGVDWTETYTLRNDGDSALTVGSLAVSTPWRDVYFSAADSLARAVHAHVWTGGRDSWVWATPMDGSGPGLGLTLTAGELWAYSVESRHQFTGSNVRGHLFLHVTDHARAAHALGGQPEIRLEPGAAYGWGWRLAWYDSLAALRASRRPLVEAAELAVEVGGSITLRPAEGVRLSEPTTFTGLGPGIHHVGAERDGQRSRICLLVHPPLRDLVLARLRFVLDHQRPTAAPGSLAGAFVPYDVTTGLTVQAGGWGDWNDARERVGTALLLQEARDRGWGPTAEIQQALTAYERFVAEHVVASDGTVADDTRRATDTRLYNYPWFVRFALGQGDLERAMTIMDRYYALGGAQFLAFELGPLLRELATALEQVGRPADAARMRDHLAGHAAVMLDHGADLPAHEVNYEQSMVAPLVELLLAAWAEDPGTVPVAELDRRLAWLTAFAADQPDARLHHVPIRHWDGYWFGRLRLWGDTFPHYWSILSAAVYLRWPAALGGADRADELHRRGHAILRGTLANFGADGSASCAFVYPSCVDGRPAHVADPLANDQDWALVYALRFGLDPPGESATSRDWARRPPPAPVEPQAQT